MSLTSTRAAVPVSTCIFTIRISFSSSGGVPDAVFSQGKTRWRELCRLPDNAIHLATIRRSLSVVLRGGISQRGAARSHTGLKSSLKKATLLFDFSTLAGEASTAVPLTLLNDEGEVEQVDLGDVDPIDAFVG